jgi:hypothetical protein
VSGPDDQSGDRAIGRAREAPLDGGARLADALATSCRSSASSGDSKMDRRRRRLALAAGASLLMSGCFSIQHTVGRGPQHVPVDVEYRERWYGLFGLWPLDEYDSKLLANGSRDYRVTTEFTFSDVVISTLTSFVTFYRQTIIVEK